MRPPAKRSKATHPIDPPDAGHALLAKDWSHSSDQPPAYREESVPVTGNAQEVAETYFESQIGTFLFYAAHVPMSLIERFAQDLLEANDRARRFRGL